MKISLYTYIGLGFGIASIFGVEKYGISDYRVLGIGILSIYFLLIEIIKYYKTKQK